MYTKEYEEGYHGYDAGATNPYQPGTQAFDDWHAGYCQSEKETDEMAD